MLTGLMLTIGSLLFAILLFIVYFSKQRFLSIRNKIYRYMLVVEMVLLVSEIVASLSLKYYNNEVFNLFLHRIHWSTGILWFSLLYYYSLVFLNNIDKDNLIDIITLNKKVKIISLIFLILGFIYFLVPFERLDPNNISYIPGPASFYVLLFCAFVVFLISVYTLKNTSNVPFRKKLSIWLMIIELVIIFALQLLFPTTAFSAMGAAIQMYFLYFNIENPDLKIINELETLKDEIERSNKAKSDFLSNMSHEIRSPMNAIVGLSESLVNNPNFNLEEAKSDIKHIASAGNNLLDIINNILDISKIESGRETLDLKEYSIGNILMELSSIIDARLSDKPVKLIMEVDSNIPSKLYGDSTKIFQILLNILTNSVKYTEVGKIKLSLTFDTSNDLCNLHFKISDTGFGIKKEDYDKLFEKFSRLDTATEKEIEGTGLGLVITKKYVDLMKGKIWFESEYEVGTTFFVDITQKIIDSKKLGAITEPVKSDDNINYLDLTGKRILIVDDNKLNIKVATRILSSYKFTIDTCENGKDCIYKVKEGIKYDMIFIDHMMPEMDGIEVMHVLKKLEGYTIPPLVALTANAITGMKEMYLKEGFDEYLSKPINISELNKIIEKYFKK